ncbi:MAG: carboxypeptidase regulatory-like domain-containing protein, partial [Pseudomonadota bacterium]
MLLPAVLSGQATDSILVGAVTDSTGGGIQSAAVRATNKNTNFTYTAVANAAGEYRINDLSAGRYDVSVSAQRFALSSVANVDLQLNRTSSVNFTLQVAALSTSVEVREAPSTIDMASSQVLNSFDSRSASDLIAASTGSGVLNFSLLGGGVASSGGIGSGAGPSVGGQRPSSNSFNIDGVDNNNHNVTGAVVYVSNEAVAQVTILQNQYGAEFSGGAGGIFNMVVKSGTNQLHGSLYEYLQNRNLDAVDAQLVHQGVYSMPRVDNNRLGATLGGPVFKDKLFYYGNFEYLANGEPSAPKGPVYAPTAAGYRTLDGLGGVSPTNLRVLEQYLPAAPAATRSTSVLGVNIPTGPLSLVAPSYYDCSDLVSGIDWNPGHLDQLRARYIYNRYSGIDTSANLPAFYSTVPNNRHLFSLSEFHTFSAEMENELRLSFNRENNNFAVGNQTFPGLDTFPN